MAVSQPVAAVVAASEAAVVAAAAAEVLAAGHQVSSVAAVAVWAAVSPAEHQAEQRAGAQADRKTRRGHSARGTRERVTSHG